MNIYNIVNKSSQQINNITDICNIFKQNYNMIVG